MAPDGRAGEWASITSQHRQCKESRQRADRMQAGRHGGSCPPSMDSRLAAGGAIKVPKDHSATPTQSTRAPPMLQSREAEGRG